MSQEVIDRALDVATGDGAAYAEVRVSEHRSQGLTVKDGSLQATTSDLSAGYGVRVLVDGAWGFAASADVEPAQVEIVARRALAIARASAGAPGPAVTLDDTPPARGTYRTPVAEDPFSVSIDEKLRLLFDLDAEMGRVSGLTTREATLEAFAEHKTFASSAGAHLVQDIVEVGAGLTATASDEHDSQDRSFPNSLGGQMVTGGWEAIRGMALAENAPRIAEEAVALLTAPQCPSGEMTAIIGSSQLALQVHESCGHPIELDRVMGMEASFAGTSFLTLDQLNALQYGSRLVNIDADATAPGGLGTFGWDDEGVPAQNVPIVSAGRFVGYLTSRETAPIIGRRSMGSARAGSWRQIPLIRMTNVNLRPGEAGSLEDLIADTDDGILFDTNRSWSIDDRRLNFQFGTQAGWLIKNGRLTQLVKNPTYTGITPRFWNSCDAICGREAWVLWGVPNCGKGEPMQTAHVGHGAAPARFRKVQVGVGQWQ